ncbi:hypothetical protein V3C99_011407, partial [Haemonchus contortus]
MMQARKIKYDVTGVIETRRHRLLHAVFENGEGLFLGACDSRDVLFRSLSVILTPRWALEERLKSSASGLTEWSRMSRMEGCPNLSCRPTPSMKAFDTVETEAEIEALGNQGEPTQYIRMLRELYDNFTPRISPFYNKVIINVKRGAQQGDTIPPKLFSAALENIMRHSEWEDLEVKVDGRYLHCLRSADDIVLITPYIE